MPGNGRRQRIVAYRVPPRFSFRMRGPGSADPSMRAPRRSTLYPCGSGVPEEVRYVAHPEVPVLG